MPQSATKMHRAKAKRDNEFYTSRALVDYFFQCLFNDPNCKDVFRGKIVCCPCDTEKSEFVKWFQEHFDDLGLKDLWYFVDYTNDRVLEADYIVTNPPFSGINKWLQWLCDYGKKWAVVRNIVPYYKLKSSWLFDRPETSYMTAGDWAFDRPDGSKRVISVNFSSNFCDYRYTQPPTELFFSDYPHPIYSKHNFQSKGIDVGITEPIYYIEAALTNGIPRDAKYIALPYSIGVTGVVGYEKVGVHCSGIEELNTGYKPWARVMFRKVGVLTDWKFERILWEQIPSLS